MAHKYYYHYTTLKGLIGILETGEIKLAIESITHKKEKPVVWISTNDFWEPTATKVVRSLKGRIIKLTFEEQALNYGCARIQVMPDKLMTWGKLKHVARMYLTNAFLMEQVQGAEPKNWY